MVAFVGEIRWFGFDFALEGWALCDGAILDVAKSPPLYAVIGNRFGGVPQKTFGLPNLIGRAVRGIPADKPAVASGAPTIKLTGKNVPRHNHRLVAATFAGATNAITQSTLKQAPQAGYMLSRLTRSSGAPTITASFAKATNGSALHPAALDTPSMADEIEISAMNPYLVLNPCICLEGDFPLR